MINLQVKSVNTMINDYCSNRCNSCDIWKNKDHHDLTVDDIRKLVELFPNAEDISFTGGEPFLRKDLSALISQALKASNLKMFFTNTNGTHPDRVKDVLSDINYDNFHLCVSVEGSKDVHNGIRGVNSFDKCLETLAVEGKHHKIISTTLQRSNSTVENMQFLMNIAKDFNANLTFRFASIGPYYMNDNPGFKLDYPTKTQINEVMTFMAQHRKDEYFRLYHQFLNTGDIPLMKSSGKVNCKAGEYFVIVKPNGDIAPCIYSSRTIGNLNEGIRKIEDRGKFEPCPCFTECTIYPMLNYSKQNETNPRST